MDPNTMRKNFSYSTVKGYFLQDEPTTLDYDNFDYVSIVRMKLASTADRKCSDH